MPIAEVLDPDGSTIHQFEVPEGAKPADIEAFAAQTLTKPANQNMVKTPVSATDAALSSGIDAVPFGSDIAASFEALKNPEGGSFADKQAAAKAQLQEVIKGGQEQHPVASGAGTVAGIGATLPLIPAKALQGASLLARLGKGAIAGATLSGLHGAGEGNTADERASNAITGAVVGTPLGAGGALGAEAIGLGYRASRNLAERAANLVKNSVAKQSDAAAGASAAQGAVDNGLSSVKQALDSAPPVTPPAGEPIPLTQGQTTQDPRLQSLESGAAAGIHGDEAQQLMNETRTLQSDKAKDAMSGIAGKELTPDVPADATATLTDNLRSAYAAAKSRTSADYKAVGDLSGDQPLKIAGDYIRNGVAPSFKEWATQGSNGRAWDLNARGMEEGKRLYQQAQSFAKNENVAAADFFKMEDWRSAVSQGIANAATPSEKAFLSGLMQRYDTAMKQLPREAIKGGDEGVIAAMEKARTSRKDQGIRFERSKLVRDIVQNDDLTNEQFANSILSLGPKSGAYVRDIVRTAGQDSEAQSALQQQIKQAVLGSIVNKSLSAEVKAGSSIDGGIDKMMSFDKLATNLDKLVNNKTLFERVVPDPAERDMVQKVYRAASLIKSQKPGTKNYSNSAYTILNVLRSVSPSVASTNIMGVGAGSGLKAAAQSGALNELQHSIAPVLKGISDDAGTVTNFGKKYGRQIMAGGGQAASNAETDKIIDPAEAQ